MSETNIPSENSEHFQYTNEGLHPKEETVMVFMEIDRLAMINLSLKETITQQASTIAALQAEKEETKKDFYWQGVEISELKAENERLKRLIDGPPHLQKIWDDFMKENNL